MKNAVIWLGIMSLASALFSSGSSEAGSYRNPHPRPYEKCEASDLVKLTACCNEVLAKLDDCKPDDLACECCALQSMDPDCYNLCPENPSVDFLSVLNDDCAELNHVNSCNMPFQKSDADSKGVYGSTKESKFPLFSMKSPMLAKKAEENEPGNQVLFDEKNYEAALILGDENAGSNSKIQLALVPNSNATALTSSGVMVGITFVVLTAAVLANTLYSW